MEITRQKMREARTSADRFVFEASDLRIRPGDTWPVQLSTRTFAGARLTFDADIEQFSREGDFLYRDYVALHNGRELRITLYND